MSKSKLYLGSIDLNKIKKTDIVKTDKDGKPFKNGAKYLNVALFVNEEPDQYGNHIALKSGKKDESYYIGNAKKYVSKNSAETKPQQVENNDDDNLPF